MSTSGTTTFIETRDQIITNALSLLQAVGAGETVAANDITYCATMLNAMVKAWMGQGIHLFTEEEGTVYFVNGQAAYLLQPSSMSGYAYGSDGTGTPQETTLTATGSGTSLTVASTTGMTTNDIIGIELNNNTIQWTTIASVPTSTTLTINASLTSSASSGNQVYTYTTNMQKALSVNSVRIRDENGYDRPIEIRPKNDYMRIPEKANPGTPVMASYMPGNLFGTLYLWPTPNDVGQRAKITYLRIIQDFDAAGDNPDFPSEWLEALTYNLAVRVAPAYGFNLTTSGLTGNPDLIRMANQFLEDLKAWDAEQPWVKIIPKRRR